VRRKHASLTSTTGNIGFLPLLVFSPKIAPEDADVGVFHQHLQISLAPTCSKNCCQLACPFTNSFVLYQNYVFYDYTKPQAFIARRFAVGYSWWRHDQG
jgi:hypothetical protein